MSSLLTSIILFNTRLTNKTGGFALVGHRTDVPNNDDHDKKFVLNCMN